jgi:hypothetical protein
MMLAAVELGIGSGHSAARDQVQAQRVLGFPDGYFCAYLIAFGYPADRPLKRGVKDTRQTEWPPNGYSVPRVAWTAIPTARPPKSGPPPSLTLLPADAATTRSTNAALGIRR